jgi:hypothetical protein
MEAKQANDLFPPIGAQAKATCSNDYVQSTQGMNAQRSQYVKSNIDKSVA